MTGPIYPGPWDPDDLEQELGKLRGNEFATCLLIQLAAAGEERQAVADRAQAAVLGFIEAFRSSAGGSVYADCDSPS